MQGAARNSTVDLMRGIAILMMVAFHFCYDLKFFGYVSWDVPDGNAWRPIRYIILFLFLTCVGYGGVQQHRPRIRWSAFNRRLLRIALGAGAVTLVSVIIFPEQWIYFGILHFIVIGTLIALLLRHHPTSALIMAVVIFVLGFYHLPSRTWPFTVWSGYLPGYSVDYVPLLPWLGPVLLGVWLAHNRWFTTGRHAHLNLSRFWHWLSRHSLKIYLLHQPALFALFYGHREWFR